MSPRPAVPEAAALERARGDAIKALARRAMTRRALVDLLVRRRHAPEVAEAIAEEMVGRRAIDDAQFAHTRAEAARGRASRAETEHRLVARGVDEPLAERTVRTTSTEADEVAAAVALARARAGAARPGTDRDVLARRTAAALARRGFEEDAVRRAIEAVWPGSAGLT